jgi:hypothetical protein
VLPLSPRAKDYVMDRQWQALKTQADTLATQIEPLDDEMKVCTSQGKVFIHKKQLAELLAKRTTVVDQMETVKVSYQAR